MVLKTEDETSTRCVALAASVPGAAITEYEKVYPFGWLGLLSDSKRSANDTLARPDAVC